MHSRPKAYSTGEAPPDEADSGPSGPVLTEATGDASDWDGVSERRTSDRRSRPTRAWGGLIGPLRRAHGRRDEDRNSYVDRYTRRDVALLMAVFLLNVGDAFFTMLWLSRGGREANPVMDFFLDIGTGAFLVQKCLVVGFWLLILLVHKNFRMARLGLYASLVVYALLMGLHFSIILLGIEPPSAEVSTHPSVDSELERPIGQHAPQTRILVSDFGSERALESDRPLTRPLSR